MTKSSPTLRIRTDTREMRILEFLNQVGFLTLNTFLLKGFSRARLGRLLFGLDELGDRIRDSDYEKYKRIFSATLTRLKAKGYLTKEGVNNHLVWKISEDGKNFLKYSKNDLPDEDGVLRLFIFDIPEDLKRHRDWIRVELILSGYRLLQKSVWLGKRPLAKEFLQELLDRNLFRFIHFFEVKEKGTLSGLEKID